jgi:phospholipid transport system transporter-binding protein
VKQPAPQVIVTAPGRIAVNSPMTFQNAPQLCAAGIACFVRDGSPVVVVDCAGVSQADSSGLAVLIEWRRWAHQQGRHVKFANLPVQVSAIAHLSEVSEVLENSIA